MLRINQLRLPVEHTPEQLTRAVKKLLRCDETPGITVVRRSIDARKKPVLYFNYILNIKVKHEREIYRRCDRKAVFLWEEKPYCFPVSNYQGKIRPVIIGTGPAGLFCGYVLASAGYHPILLERGEAVKERIRTVQTFWDEGILNPESNVQFGEGGAGTFSDGKLNTLVKDKSGRNQYVLSLFVKFGAPETILYDHKPHIGTDLLVQIVQNMRNAIRKLGGEVRFGAKVTGLEQREGHLRGLIINEEERLDTDCVVLAPGHSARDTFAMLYEEGVSMEAKPFAVGVRVEHPQELINRSQYGVSEAPLLGSAPYKVTARTSGGRGVYSFCMCPGGYVVNASSEPDHLVVNGMSYSDRAGTNANSAIIVSVTPEDYSSAHPLAGVAFQRQLEQKAFCCAGGKIPVERYGDYRRNIINAGEAGDIRTGETKAGTSLIPGDFQPCIKGAWAFAPVHEILPEAIGRAFVEGMEQFGGVIRGFQDENVLVEGLESRTSSPVRILRDDTLQSSLKGLFPCGEGAGYAGGITSAAMDGIRTAEAVAAHIAKL